MFLEMSPYNSVGLLKTIEVHLKLVNWFCEKWCIFMHYIKQVVEDYPMLQSKFFLKHFKMHNYCKFKPVLPISKTVKQSNGVGRITL